jgi:S1-C subfamily serine protease
MNQEPSLPGPESLQQETLKEFDAQIAKGFSEVLPVWLAAKASSALSSRKPFDALGYLTLLRITKVPDSDPDLLKFKKQQLSSQLLSVPEIEAQRQMLSAFEARLQRATEAKAPADGSGKLRFLGSALKAVVIVRRGDIEGTGFLVSSSGLIVTNYHVVETSGRIEVETSEGEAFLASLVNQSPEKDLALLQIPASSLPYLQLASSEETEIGEEVYALGNPRGLQGTVTKGIISAKRRFSGTWHVQIDASINPGNSGGPLLLSDGRVVGVNTLRLRDSEGLNFAISIDEVKTAFPVILRR